MAGHQTGWTFRYMNDNKKPQTSSHQIRPETHTERLLALGKSHQIRPVSTGQQSDDRRVVHACCTSNLTDAPALHRLTQSLSNLLGVRGDRRGRNAVRPAVYMIPRRACQIAAFRHPANVANRPQERCATFASGESIHHTEGHVRHSGSGV